jgi:hypothetical protein
MVNLSRKYNSRFNHLWQIRERFLFPPIDARNFLILITGYRLPITNANATGYNSAWTSRADKATNHANLSSKF